MDLERRSVNGLQFLFFPASLFSLYVDSIQGNRASPHDSDEALALSGATAVLDGPMFEICSDSAGDTYATASCGVVQYRHVAPGVNISSSYPSRGLTISVLSDGTVDANAGDQVVPGAKVAVQLYPALVVQGQAAPVSSSDSASRAALAITTDGRLAFVVSAPMSLQMFADRLAASGLVQYAGYTDGGGSASLATSDGGYSGSSEHRRVVTWLIAKARTPSVVIPFALGLATLGGLYWWSKRQR